jgi:hypothetical protein
MNSDRDSNEIKIRPLTEYKKMKSMVNYEDMGKN